MPPLKVYYPDDPPWPSRPKAGLGLVLMIMIYDPKQKHQELHTLKRTIVPRFFLKLATRHYHWPINIFFTCLLRFIYQGSDRRPLQRASAWVTYAIASGV